MKLEDSIRRELENLIGRVNNSFTREQVKERLYSLMSQGDSEVYRYLDVHVGMSKADPTVLIITPLNVLTGMHMLGQYYPPYMTRYLLGKKYEDETGVYEVFDDEYGDPCFMFTPRSD